MRYFNFHNFARQSIISPKFFLIICSFIYLIYILLLPLVHANNDTNNNLNTDLTFSPEETSTGIITDRVTPLLDWVLDQSGQLTINQVLSPEVQRTFSSFLFADLPKQEGTFWFRFVIDSTNRLSSSDFILDLSKRTPTQFPEPTQVWVVSMGSGKATLINPIKDNSYPIKYSGAEVLEVYIKLPGAPGVGFTPVLWTKKSFSTFYSSIHIAMLFLLAITIAICLIRAFTEKQEWRIWAALYSGSILISTLWGLPPTPKGILTIWDIPGLLAPGIALFILPHIGRRLMNTRQVSPHIDVQLLLLTLPGLVLSILPLIPGYLWTLPYLSIWPLITILFLPTCLYARFCELKQSKIFFTICAFPSIGILPLAISINSIPQYIPIGLINLFPLITLTLSAMLVALVSNPKPSSGAIRRESPSSNIKIPSIPNKQTKTMKKEEEQRTTTTNLNIESLEQQLRAPLERIRKELSILNTSLQSTPLHQHIESIENTAEGLSHIINDIPELFISKTHTDKEIFDLNQIVLGIHDAVNNDAESKNLAFSWFIAPHLYQKYEGNPTQLTQVLYMLVESAIQATEKGLVQLRIQRAPNSINPGELLITVSDSGKGSPPITRSPLALIHAWELATSTGGSVTMKSEPTGTTISFSISLTAKQTNTSLYHQHDESVATTEQPTTQLSQIIIVDIVPSNRQLLTYYLDELPYNIFEAQDVTTVYNLYKQSPGAVIIFGPDLPETIAIETIGAIRVFEGEHSFPPAPILAICKTEAQRERLLRIGCTHVIIEPLTRKTFRQTILQLSPISKHIQAIPNPLVESTSSKIKQTAPINSVNSKLIETGNASQIPCVEPPIQDIPISPHVPLHSEDNTSEYTHEKKGIALLKTPEQIKTKKLSIIKGEPTPTISSSTHQQRSDTSLNNNANYKVEQYPLMSSSEWVGEPTPIIKQKTSTNKTSTRLSQHSSEWVGEPIPIIKRKKPPITSPKNDPLHSTAEWVGEPMPITITQQESLTIKQQPIVNLTDEQLSLEERKVVEENYTTTIEKTLSAVPKTHEQLSTITKEKIEKVEPIVTTNDIHKNSLLENDTSFNEKSAILQNSVEIPKDLSTYSSSLSIQNFPEKPFLSSQSEPYNNSQPINNSSKEIDTIQEIPITLSDSVSINQKDNESHANLLATTTTKQKKYNTSRQKNSRHQKSSLSLLDMITIPTEENQETNHPKNTLNTDSYLSMVEPPEIPEEHIITLTETVDTYKKDTLAGKKDIPDLFSVHHPTEITEDFTYPKEQSEQLSMMQLFSSTLNLVEENNLGTHSKELFQELDITLGLLQQAIQTKQSENLVSFSQVILSLSEQLKLKHLKTLSYSLLDAIQTSKEDIIEQLIKDMKAEVQHSQGGTTDLL